jgi:hypothetical protein
MNNIFLQPGVEFWIMNTRISSLSSRIRVMMAEAITEMFTSPAGMLG